MQQPQGNVQYLRQGLGGQVGTVASGCRMECEWNDTPYSDLRDNQAMVALYAANSATLGRPLADPRQVPGVVGSTDMGNVSYLVPTIHPMIKVSPPNVAIHSADFTEWAVSADGDRAVVDGAKAMAMTVVDLWTRPETLRAARDEFAAIAGSR